jgi:ribonuclease P protein component
MAPERSFPRQLRLVHSRQYQRVFSDTHCKSSDALLIVLARRNDRKYPRLGLAIAKKKIKTAVARQRIKRIVRESFRHHKDQLSGLDIVVLGHARANNATNKQLFNSLQHHWLRLAKQCKN